MTDEKNTALVFFQGTFQLFLGIYIQMVGWLVQKEDVGWFIQNLAQPDLSLLATGEYTYLTFNVFCSQTTFGQGRAHLKLIKSREFLPDFFDAGGRISCRSFLFKVSDILIVAQCN